MGKLTDTRLRAMRPNGKVQKASDGDGLYAYLGARSKGISWQMAYRFENRQKVLTLGQYPAVSVAEARRRCLAARQVLASGLDPRRSQEVGKAGHSARRKGKGADL